MRTEGTHDTGAFQNVRTPSAAGKPSFPAQDVAAGPVAGAFHVTGDWNPILCNCGLLHLERMGEAKLFPLSADVQRYASARAVPVALEEPGAGIASCSGRSVCSMVAIPVQGRGRRDPTTALGNDGFGQSATPRFDRRSQD